MIPHFNTTVYLGSSSTINTAKFQSDIKEGINQILYYGNGSEVLAQGILDHFGMPMHTLINIEAAIKELCSYLHRLPTDINSEISKIISQIINSEQNVSYLTQEKDSLKKRVAELEQSNITLRNKLDNIEAKLARLAEI